MDEALREKLKSYYLCGSELIEDKFSGWTEEDFKKVDELPLSPFARPVTQEEAEAFWNDVFGGKAPDRYRHLS